MGSESFAMIQENQPVAPSRDVVAVVGMAGRFPGANSVAQFWKNLRDGVESIREFTPEELQASGVGPDALDDPSYVRVGAPLEDADCFDAAFFGYNPREAELMDPQQRLFLECAYAALQDAGYDPARLQVPVGVFGGVARNTYFIRNAEVYRSLMDQGALYEAILGSEKDFTATRVSFKLNLKGPGINVQTACSTSGIAVHLACQSLLAGECDMAIAGGGRIRVPLHAGYLYVDGGIPSPDGHCRAFDAGANGCVFGSGVAMLTLKRLADAIEDGDQIDALILATVINNDGSAKVGFTAPSVEGQSAAIEGALAMADVDADTIDFVEAHGTGTTLGDPIEIAALTRAFRQSSERRNYCAIGSVKTNIGHLDAGAGAAGLIKTILSLKHAQIPPSLNFTRPNPQIDFENSPFFVNDKLRDWDANETPRRAGVSAFGLGGTNFHAIVEEAPVLDPSGPGRLWHVLPLSARSGDILNRATADLAEHLTENPEQNLADAAYTLQLGRPNFEHRRFVVCSGVEHAVEQLHNASGVESAKVATAGSVPVVFMFPGQGAQHVNMGRDLYQLEEVFRKEVDACCKRLEPMLGLDLRELLSTQPSAEEDAAERLKQTSITQPALFVIEYALARLWQSWGIEPEAMIGHSVGEYVAATVAGVFSVEDALKLLVARGKFMQQQPAGSMLAVQLPEEKIQAYLSGNVGLAAYNAPSLGVVSGPTDEIETLERRLTEEGATTQALVTSHAFHSRMMEPAVEPFLEEAQGVQFNVPTLPFISSLTGTWITDEQATSAEYWGQQLRQPVHFSRGICELQNDPQRVLLEVGPGKTLSMLAQRHRAKEGHTTVVASLRHPRETDPDLACLMTALGELWAAGVEIAWERLYVGQGRRRVSLPTYPFERKRFWLRPKRDSDDFPQPRAAVGSGEARTSSVSTLPNVEVPSGAHVAAQTSDSHSDLGTSQPQTTPPSQAYSNISRKEYLILKITSLLEEVSGLSLEGADVSTSFLKLGLDSLLLTQATNLFRRTFGVKITFRQVMGDLSSADDLSSYLDQHLPAEAFQPEAFQPAPAKANGSGWTIKAPVRTQAPHGPFKPLNVGRDTKLTQRQQQHLDALVARSTKKTARSKEKAGENRPILADPRSASGFKPYCKELVYPLYTDRSEGSKVWDIDGNEYVDFVMGFGASLFGHRPPFVVEAVKAQLDAGFEVGPIHPMAGEVASLVKELTGAERVGFCNTGSEAVLAAIRVARTVSGRDRIAMFAGAYHGIFDEVLARPLVVNGELQSGPAAAGIPIGSLGQVCVLEYGNPQSLEILRQHGNDFAAVLVEPVQSRHLDLVPRDFLRELRQITASTDTALIFDEVVTGFRVQPGGAQSYFGIRADLATYGKVVGGGLPIGVVTGKAVYMDALDGGGWQYGDDSFPEVGVTFFAGTFVRHPLALAAAKSVLEHLKQQGPDLQVRTEEKAARVAAKCQELFARYSAPYRLSQFSSLMHLEVPPEFTYGGLLFYHLRDRGIHIFEGRILVFTTAHTEADEKQLLQAIEDSLEEMQQGGFLSSESASEVNASVRDSSACGVAPSLAMAECQSRPNAGAKDENRCSTLEEIQGEGERPPLFCMPAADGLTLVYHELADRLGCDQPVYGLNSPGAMGEDAPVNIEEMATRFIEDIQEIRPHGPYLLAGYCSGGTIAFEVAQQLVAAGEQVAFVCGIETYDWSTAPAANKTLWVRTYYEIQRILYTCRNFQLLSRHDKGSFLRSKFDRTKSRVRVWRGMVTGLFTPKKRQFKTQGVNWNELWRVHDEISVQYIPRPYPKKLLLIRPQQDYHKYAGTEELRALGGVNIVRIRSFPAGLMVSPFVDEVAKLVATSIDEGLRECGIETTTANRVPDAAKTAGNTELSLEKQIPALQAND